MENVNIWVTIGVGIVIASVGGVLHTLIVNKINEGNKRDDEIEAQQKSDRDLFFTRLDTIKDTADKTFVKKELYEQSVRHASENNIASIKVIIDLVNSKFDVLNSKLDEKVQQVKDLETKIDELRLMFIEKLK